MSGSRTRPSSRQTKPRRADETAKCSAGSRGSASPAASVVASTLRRSAPWRSASPLCGERDDDPVAGANEPGELVLRLGEAARGDRGRCASNWNACPRGKGSSSVAPRATTGSSPCSSQTRRTSSGCQTTSGARSIGATRSPADDRRGSSSSSGGNGDVHEIDAPLRGRIDGRLRDWMQGALRERRERAHLLDLVAEQLDPQRLPAGRGEDVDDAAADGELAALLDPVDALVAGERQLSASPSMPGSSPTRSATRARSRGERAACPRPALPPTRTRGRRRRARRARGPLADQVRRRLETGGGRDATARQQRHPSSPRYHDAPSAASRASASSGSSTTSAAAELLVEGREHERQSRIGDACARRQRLRRTPGSARSPRARTTKA